MDEQDADEAVVDLRRSSPRKAPSVSSTLSAEELEKKRARDRKSQRAMRDRANWTIYSLQEQVTQLTQTLAIERNEIAELRRAIHLVGAESDRLRSENASLRLQMLSRDESLLDPGTRALSPHEMVPMNKVPTCLSDQILQSFVESRRLTPLSFDASNQLEAAEGLNINYLLDRSQYKRANTISHIVTDVVRSYTEIETLPRQVACLYVINHLLTWLIMLDEHTYNKMPEWLRPIPVQTKVPHAAWIDRIPWPTVREYLIQHQEITFDEFAAVYSSSFSVWWPFDAEHVIAKLTPPQSSTPMAVINPIYEEHLRQLRNWTVGDTFRLRFPAIGELVDQYSLQGPRHPSQ